MSNPADRFPGPGPGRPKGIPNKATTKAREAIAAFVDGNSERIQQWLDEVYAQKGAEAALNAFTGFLEFHVPKLARTEMTGLDGADLVPKEVTLKFVKSSDSQSA